MAANHQVLLHANSDLQLPQNATNLLYMVFVYFRQISYVSRRITSKGISYGVPSAGQLKYFIPTVRKNCKGRVAYNSKHFLMPCLAKMRGM